MNILIGLCIAWAGFTVGFMAACLMQVASEETKR